MFGLVDLVALVLGSIGAIERRAASTLGAYGISKAALHYIVRKAHFEGADKGLVAVVLDPGFMQSTSGNEAARRFGMKEAPTPVKDSAAFIVNKVYP